MNIFLKMKLALGFHFLNIFVLSTIILIFRDEVFCANEDVELNRNNFSRKNENCKCTNDENPINGLHCEVSVELSDVSSTCFKTEKNSLVVVFGKFSKSASFVCQSSEPFTMLLNFENGAPIILYSKIRNERICEDFFDQKSCSYLVTVNVPPFSGTFGQLKYNTMVQYKVFDLKHSENVTNVLWNFINEKAFENDVHWLADRFAIEVHFQSSTVLIPCVSDYPQNATLYRIESNAKVNISSWKTEHLEKLEGSFISYDASEGFSLDLMIYKNYVGKYICTLLVVDENLKPGMDWKQFNNKTVYFEIHISEYRSDLDTQPGNSILPVNEISYGNLANPNEELQDNLSFYDDLKGGYSYPAVKIFYLPSGGLISCHVRKNKATLRQMSCNTVYECEVFAKCMLIKNTVPYDLSEINRNSRCLKALSISSGSCSSRNPYESNEESTEGNSGKELSCEIGKPFGRKGIVQCSSETGELILQRISFEGFDNKIYGSLISVPVPAILKLTKLFTGEVFTGGSFTYECEAHSFFYEQRLMWILKLKTGSLIQMPKERYKEVTGKSFAPSIDEDDNNPKSVIEVLVDEFFLGVCELICLAPLVNTGFMWHNISTSMKVIKSVAPEILTQESEISFKIGQIGQGLTCQVEGFPNPEITWLINGMEVEEPFNVLDNVIYKVLYFPTYKDEFAGKYECTATNVEGNTSKIFTVSTFLDNDSKNYVLFSTASAAAGFIILIFLIALLYLAQQRKQKLKKIQELEEIITLLNGNTSEAIEPDILGPFDVPYDKSLEMERNSFFVDKNKVLGTGNYGIVYKGRSDLVDGDIAIKTGKKNCPMNHIKSIVSELKIMSFIGMHENIVQLIGAYTQEIDKGVIFIALEFCALGSLESYLKSHRNIFLRSMNPITPRKGYTSQTIFNSNFKFSRIKSLRIWAAQIANAMMHLGEKNIIHSDLAGRNVLITLEGVVKLADFGLSRRLYDYEEYIKNGLESMPWKILALESIKAKIYSVKSDVWAYGILLWEIFSLGDIPYPGIEFDFDFLARLESGFRNPCPKYASQELYAIMLQCWNSEPEERPTFETLRQFFESIISDDEPINEISKCSNSLHYSMLSVGENWAEAEAQNPN